MRKLYFLILLMSSFSFGQTGSIQGNVYDRIAKDYSAYDGISLFEMRKDKSIKIVQADEFGNFKFEKLKIGHYSIKILNITEETVISNIDVSENTVTYINAIIPAACKYDDENINHKICPICNKEDNAFPIRLYMPHYTIYKKGLEPKNYRHNREYEKFDLATKTYIDCKSSHPYCYPKWYCLKDKVKF